MSAALAGTGKESTAFSYQGLVYMRVYIKYRSAVALPLVRRILACVTCELRLRAISIYILI